MKNKLKKGITLVELVVSVSIFSFVLLSVFSVYSFSVVETYKQTKGMNSHINSIGHVESRDLGLMMNVDTEKSINLFEGLSSETKPILGRGVQTTVFADNYGNGMVVSISTPEDALFYKDSELGRVGPRFANLLLPQEVYQNVKNPYPEEYRDNIASYFVDNSSENIDMGSKKHAQFDFSKYNLPKGKYNVRYLVYRFDDYSKMLLASSGIYNKFPKGNDSKHPAEICKDIPIDKKAKSIFVSSHNPAYVDSSIMEESPDLALQIIKNPINDWSLFGKDGNHILRPGKYMFVFELTLDSLGSGETPSVALSSFRKLRHLSDIDTISKLENGKRLIARDIIAVESLEPNVFVNTGSAVYIGSNFEKNNLTKNKIGRPGEVEEFGALPDAKHYIKNKEYSYPNIGFILNESSGNSNVYQLSKEDASKLEKISGNYIYVNLNKNISRFSSSLSPYSRHGKPGATFVVEKGTDKLLHVDKRFDDFGDRYRDKGKNYMDGNVYIKNKRLFDASTLNIALLKDGKDGRIFMTDAWMYRPLFGKNRRYYEIHKSDSYSDLYVDLGYDSNSPCNHYLGISENRLDKIYTKYKVEEGYDVENVEYVFYKSDVENPMSYSEATNSSNGYLKDYKFERIIPISLDQCLILAKKNNVGKLFLLTKDVFTKDVKVIIQQNINASGSSSDHNGKKVDKNELEDEKEIFKEEVKIKLKDKIKQEVERISEKNLKEFKKRLKDEVMPQAKIREDYVDQGIQRMVDRSLDSLIMETLDDKEIEVEDYRIFSFSYRGLRTKPTTVNHSVSNFNFVIDDTLEISEYAITETSYPEFDTKSSDSIVRDMAAKMNDLKFEYYGNDLYVYSGNKLYKLPPKLENEIQNPELILTTEDAIKNVYIHDKSKFIEIK